MTPSIATDAHRMRTRILAWIAVVASLTVATSCNRVAAPPTGPTPPPHVEPDWSSLPLELSAERYMLQVSGGDLTGDPSLPPCSPVQAPRAGKWVTTFLWFAWEGDELVGRPRPPYRSTLDLRLRRVSSSILGVVVSGTVTGSADDEYDYIQGKKDTIFSADGRVTVDGTIAPHAAGHLDSVRLGGRFHGPTSFSDTAGDTSRCTNVQYYLEVRPPGGLDDDPTIPPVAPGLGSAAVGAPPRPDGADAPIPPIAPRPRR